MNLVFLLYMNDLLEKAVMLKQNQHQTSGIVCICIDNEVYK
jgi:hypothetical protein